MASEELLKDLLSESKRRRTAAGDETTPAERGIMLFETLVRGDVDTVKALLQHEQAALFVDWQHWEDGYCALHVTAHNGQNELMSLLLAAGANVNLAEDDGMTALHIASMNNQTECVQLLLQGGADPSIADDDGNKAVDLVDEEMQELMDILNTPVVKSEPTSSVVPAATTLPASATRDAHLDEVREWLAMHFAEEYFDNFANMLGAKCMGDMALLTEEDLQSINMKVLDRRRLLVAIANMMPKSRL